MPPKKSAPPAASDESDSDFDDEPVKKTHKKPTKESKKEPTPPPKNPDQILEDAVNALYAGSDGEDDDADLFALQLPPRPQFLTKPDFSNRLMILNVEVENFKSYYGKASIGPFHKSFTSIIGPNGSGKSNLIDSLLFVFGFRASKIRSAKVGNLVHKSKGREPKSCTVTIHFQRIVDQPNQTYSVVENSNFTISRTAFTNNSSSYAIDGRPASKNEVEARLRKVDIDIEHNRFLILQGEVEQIAMMKPVKTNKNETGMVEYLEDIIGSNRLEHYVKLFQRRVNRIVCEQSQQRIAREHARSSKVAMEDQVRGAIEFLSKENETKTIQMKLDQRRRQRYLDKAAPMKEALEAKTEERKAIAEKLDANKNDYKEAEELEGKLTQERATLDKEIDKLTKELSDLSSEETRRKEALKRHTADIGKTEVEKEKELKKRANLEAAPEKAEKKIEKWKEEVETLKEIQTTANAEADRNMPEFDRESAEQKEEQKELQKVWAAVNADFNKIRSEATVASDELEDMKKLANSGTKKLDDLRTRLANYEEKHEKEKEEVASVKPEFEVAEEKLKKINVDLPALCSESRYKQHEFAKARDRLEEMRQQNTSSQSNNKTVRMLMKEKEEGRIPSFMGRLGDLGFIDKKYDAAISTNYNGRLNYLIVGHEVDAPKILDFLHANKLPRSTVQPLDKIRCNPDNLLPPAPNRYPAPRLIDLVECDPQLKPAFYDFLRESIVAETTADAQKMHRMPACKGVTVCTMQGAMIAPTGNFTGGGRPITGSIVTDRSKKAKQVSDDDKMAERHLAEKVEQLQREAEELRRKEQAMGTQQMETRRKVAELENRLTVLTNSIQADSSNMTTLRKTIEAQEKEASKVKVDQKEIDVKQLLVDELFKKRDKLGEEASKAQARQEKVQEKLDEMFRSLVQCHREEASNAQQKLLKLEKEMAKETANITNSARNIAKCDENIARLQKDIDKKKRLCEQLEEKAPDEEAIEAKKTAMEEMETKRKTLEKEYTEMSKKQSELSKAETELEEELKKKNEEVMEIKAKMRAHVEKVEEIERKLSALKVNRIPRFHFLIHSTRPEDLEMQFEEELPVMDENQSPEEVEKQKKHMACVMSDAAYALEFGMRQKVLENTESYDNVDGDKLIPVELLTEEKVREITDRDAEELQFKLKQAEQALETLKAKVDLSCIDTYVKKVKQFNEETIKMALITENYRKHNTELHRIKKMRLEEFHSAFEFIGKHLVAVYKMLTDGGDAKLEYIDKDDPFTQGISFMVRPAKKAWKQIQFLSGGEKTLSSLALIFALHMFRPTPFYVMDEIDAALDYRNVSIIAQYVLQKTENAQFIIISLRNNMFELANRLIGIYKVDGCTQNVAIDPMAVCAAAKTLAVNLDEYSNRPTLPEEVTRDFQESRNRQNKEMTAQEKQYPNFPSSSEISKAEKIVSVEGRVRKELDTTAAGPTTSRAASRATTTERAVSQRPESRINQMKIPAPRLVARSSSSAAPIGRTPRKERNDEADETTPPNKRAHSTSVRSPRKKESEEKSTRRKRGEERPEEEENEKEEVC